MGERFAIKLIRNKKTIGAFSFEGRLNIGFVLTNLIIPMITNYNIRLINSSLDDPLFAVRFLEQENEEATKIGPPFKPVIDDDSKEYIAKNYPDFDMSRTYGGENTGVIAVEKYDITSALNSADFVVAISLDINRIRMYGFYEEISPVVYESITKEDSRNLLECPYNFYNMSFNELEDARDFVEKNPFYRPEGMDSLVIQLNK